MRLPATLFGYIRRYSGKHQLALAALSPVAEEPIGPARLYPNFVR